MYYWNQRDYPDIPYPSANHPNATVSSGGCGVTSGAMIVSNMTSSVVDPIFMAQYAIDCGARVPEGTEMTILAENICKDYGLTYTTSADVNVLYDHLVAGGMAVINVSGDRSGHIGVLSSGGHFVVGASATDDGRINILDPAYYPGKFNLPGRSGKVEMNGDFAICSLDVIADDTVRDPAYWLFTKGEKQVEQWKLNIIAEAKKLGIIKEDHNPDDPATKWFVLGIAIAILTKLGKA